MKRAFLSILSISFITFLSAQPIDRSVRPKPGPPPEVKLGKSEQFILPNGLRVFVVENHKLPVITASIQLDVKPALEGEAAGTQDIVGELLTAGTATRSKDALNEAIDNIGARVTATSTSISGNSLRRYGNNLLELLGDIVLHSDFKQAELDKEKAKAASTLESQRNNPDAMLANVTAAVAFGSSHPYGEVTTDATLQNVTLERCKGFYSTYWRPNVAYMAIVGDVTVAEIKPLIEKYFGGWQQAPVPAASYKAPAELKSSRVALTNRIGAVQSVFNVVYPIDLQPGDPDVVRARVANAVLGGGSQGRLFLNLREAHGWTYGSYSNLREDDIAGTFTGYAKCRNAVTDSAITEMLAEMKRLQREPVSQAELQNRITYLTGNFAIGLENPQTVAQYAINIERYRMPKNYYTNYLKALSSVSAADVQAISRKYITPEAANIVVVGNAAELSPRLARFGKVTMYDNYGRAAGASDLKAAPAGITLAEIQKRYIAAIGGEKALNAVKDLKVVRTFQSQKGITITMTELKRSPDAFARKIEGGGNVISRTVFIGGKGYTEARGGKTDLAGAELEGAREQADIQGRLHPEKYGVIRTLKGTEKLDGRDMYVVEKKTASGRSSNEYYDAQSGLLVRETSAKQSLNGELIQTSEYLDYKEVPGGAGYKIAYKVQQQTGAQHFVFEVQSADVNKGIADKEFE